MNRRAQLEAAIEAALDAGGYDVVEPAIALLDQFDGDPDLEDDEREDAGSTPIVDASGRTIMPLRYVTRDLDDEVSDLPPLMDGGWGYGLGKLMVLDRCPCCGHQEALWQ